MLRNPAYRRTKIGRLLAGWTVPNVLRRLDAAGVPAHRNTVYSWLHGTSYPSMERAEVLVAMADGDLSIQDFTNHRREVTGNASKSTRAARRN